jgi:hypothetical protein
MRTLSFSCVALLAALLVSPGPVGAQQPNACGCYRDPGGECRCGKKGKCVCPGECEPLGCEAKRQKEADKEAEAALKRIQAKEKRKSAEAARQAKKKPPKKAKEPPKEPLPGLN